MPSDADLARSISELKDEFRTGLSSLKRELAQQHNAALKKLKTATAGVPKFKKKGNEKQFLLNSEVLEHVQSASTALQASSPQVEKALEELKKGEKKLSHRNKLILIADSSEEGWKVVNEYQGRDLADDNDDDKRIRQAEVRLHRNAGVLNRRGKVRLSVLKSPPIRWFPCCPTSFLVTALQSLPLILRFLYQVLIFRTLSVLPIGLRLTVVRVLAVALLVAVSAISGISAPSFRRSFQLANLGNVLDGLGCWCTRRGHR